MSLPLAIFPLSPPPQKRTGEKDNVKCLRTWKMGGMLASEGSEHRGHLLVQSSPAKGVCYLSCARLYTWVCKQALGGQIWTTQKTNGFNKFQEAAADLQPAVDVLCPAFRLLHYHCKWPLPHFPMSI